MTLSQKTNILLVDDVPANLVALEAILERDDLNIFKANSGNEALQLAWKYPFALALIDVQMPEMDGFELVQMLKSSRKTREIICIFVTAISKEAKYAVKGLKAGAVDYLYKPLNPLVTNAKVDTYLQIYQHKQTLLHKNRKLEHFALRVNNAGDIIAMIQPISLQIEEINPAVQKILGHDPKILAGAGLLDLIHPDDIQEVRKKIDQFVANSETDLYFEAQFRNIRHDYIWLHVHLTFKDDYLFANARDISAQRHFISQLVEAKDLAEKQRKAKEEFLANMSHEIRTPMNGIIGLTRLLKDSPLTDDQNETVKLISQSSQSLLNIINDILDLSKIESGKFNLEMIDFEIREVAKTVLSLLKNKADEKGIKLKQSIVSDVPTWLIGDPHRLNQVLVNLVGNAIKFTTSGHVEIKVSLKSKDSERCEIEVQVNDTGIGIPEDRCQAIFESFSQASSDTARKFGGTGLGLTISKKLVELHGGQIGVRSKVGKGSTFFFSLSCKLSKKNTSGQEGQKINPFDLKGLESKNILLVDDNKVNRMVGARTFKRWEMNVSLAVDGRDAVEITSKELFDIILMDIQMPEMDGYEATKAIRADLENPNHDTPILALTANVMDSVIRKSRAAGMDGTLTKPFDPQQLFDTLKQLIEKGRPESSSDPTNTRDEIDRIDLAYLRQLSGGSQQFVSQYLQTFLENTPRVMEQIQLAVQSIDQDGFVKSIQNLKQDFIYIDYEAAKELLNKLEATKLEAIDAADLETLFGSLREMVRALSKKFESLLQAENTV